MPNLMDVLAGNVTLPTKPVGKVNRKRGLTNRRYDIVGYKHSGEVIRKTNVSAAKANTYRADMRKDGCYRVDKIEVNSYVKDSNNDTHKLVFTEKNYTPALVGRVPGTIAMSEDKITYQRNVAHRKLVNNFRKNNKPTETRSDTGKYMLFHKMSGKLVAYGSDHDVAFFILNSGKPFSHYVLYVPSKVYNKLAKQDALDY